VSCKDQSNSEAADTESRQQGGNGKTHHTKADQDSGGDNDTLHDTVGKTGGGNRQIGLMQTTPENFAAEIRRGNGYRDYQDDIDCRLKRPEIFRGKIGKGDPEIQTECDTPEYGGCSQRGNQNIVQPGGGLDRPTASYSQENSSQNEQHGHDGSR